MTQALNWIPVRGDCMWPALRAGDLAEWISLGAAPAAGTVVVARTGSGLRAHRVIAAAGSTLWLCGDNDSVPDAPLPRAAVLGQVRRVRRGGRLLEPHEWDRGPTLHGRARFVLRAGVRALARWVRR
jgi:hypothetical protein